MEELNDLEWWLCCVCWVALHIAAFLRAQNVEEMKLVFVRG